jgi:integrase
MPGGPPSAHARPWNPDWVTHRVAEAADAAGVELDIKGGRHYIASQLLAGGFDLRNTAARLGHSGGGAATQRYRYGLIAALRRGTNRGTSRRETPARRVPSEQ